MSRSIALLFAFILAAPLHCQAQEATAEEQANIGNKLLKAGYLRWGRIEQRGDWIVEGVYRSNGEICDLKVRTQTYEIFDEECD